MLTINNIHYSIQNEKIFEDLSMEFCEGKVHLITGFPECGKSLLLKIIGGIIHPNEGEVFFQDQLVNTEVRHQKIMGQIGSIFDQGVLLANLNVLDNLMLPVKYLRPKYKMEDEMLRIIDLFKSFHISLDILDKRPADITYSIKKKLNFVRALLTDTVLFVIDSPLFNLDYIDQKLIISELLALKKAGYTMIIASTNRIVIQELADDVCILDQGKVIAHTDKQDFFSSGNPLIINFINKNIGA